MNLDRPVPLFVDYQTAMVEEGRIRFVSDVYGWDAKLTAALAGARLCGSGGDEHRLR